MISTSISIHQLNSVGSLSGANPGKIVSSCGRIIPRPVYVIGPMGPIRDSNAARKRINLIMPNEMMNRARASDEMNIL